jgi:hypothetical protein
MDVVVEHDDGLVEDAADVDDEDEEDEEDDDAGDDVDYIYIILAAALWKEPFAGASGQNTRQM